MDPTTAVWLAYAEHQRRTVRPMRQARMWERIARRRAEVIQHLDHWNEKLCQALIKSNEDKAQWQSERLRLLATLEEVCAERDARVTLPANWQDKVEEAIEDESWSWSNAARVVELVKSWRPTAPTQPDDSGREYPQAWQSLGPRGTIYRENDGHTEYWAPSVYGEAEPAWTKNGPAFTTLAAVRSFYRRQGRGFEPVPSPDCRNCDGFGCMNCALDGVRSEGCEETRACPVCMGGAGA